MLPRHQRLRSNQEFQRVYRGGRSWAHPLLALHVAARDDGQRIGISVSKKVGGAVLRNRVRRRLRESVRAQLPGWKAGFDAILVARAASAEADYAALALSLSELAKRARLVREPCAPEDTPYSIPAGAGREPRPGRKPAGTASPAAAEPSSPLTNR